jgi:DNA-binding transcriptional MerR regulator
VNTAKVAQSGAPGPGYGLQALADLTGVPPRTIRYYQSLGLLPHPRRQGHRAVYDEDHRDRLRLIAEMHGRGLRLSAIQDLLTREGQATRAVIDWLGLDETIHAPWTEDAPRLYTADELSRLLACYPRGTLRAMESTRMVRRLDADDDGHADEYVLPSPALFQVTLRLLDAGLDVDLVLLAGEMLRGYLAGAAGALTVLFNERLPRRAGPAGSQARATTALRGLKAVAREAAGQLFSHEIERAVDRLRISADSGPSPQPRRTRPRRSAPASGRSTAGTRG